MDNYGIWQYFDQIGKDKGVLSHGRCGIVTWVGWHGTSKDTALKTFVLHEDKGEAPNVIEIYQHELEVFDFLQPLGGTYVPEVLFHKPCPLVQ
jgi:hypothetical protein